MHITCISDLVPIKSKFLPYLAQLGHFITRNFCEFLALERMLNLPLGTFCPIRNLFKFTATWPLRNIMKISLYLKKMSFKKHEKN